MPQITGLIKQELPKPRTPHSLSALNKMTCAGLLGMALAVTANLLIVWLLHSAFVPEFFFIIVPASLASGLVARRVRWASLLGAAIALLTATLFLADPNAQYTLTHPGNSFIDFFAQVIALAFALIVVVAGIGATMQNYQVGQSSGQRWLQPFLTGLTGVVLGMLIVAALAATNPIATGTSNTSSGEPAVHMTADNFAQNVVLVPKGSRLLVVNDTSVTHILQNGMWTTSGTPEMLTEPGAPSVHHLNIARGSIKIGPFTTAGVFHLYCTIHRGMNLTIVVQ